MPSAQGLRPIVREDFVWCDDGSNWGNRDETRRRQSAKAVMQVDAVGLRQGPSRGHVVSNLASMLHKPQGHRGNVQMALYDSTLEVQRRTVQSRCSRYGAVCRGQACISGLLHPAANILSKHVKLGHRHDASFMVDAFTGNPQVQRDTAHCMSLGHYATSKEPVDQQPLGLIQRQHQSGHEGGTSLLITPFSSLTTRRV